MHDISTPARPFARRFAVFICNPFDHFCLDTGYKISKLYLAQRGKPAKACQTGRGQSWSVICHSERRFRQVSSGFCRDFVWFEWILTGTWSCIMNFFARLQQ